MTQSTTHMPPDGLESSESHVSIRSADAAVLALRDTRRGSLHFASPLRTALGLGHSHRSTPHDALSEEHEPRTP